MRARVGPIVSASVILAVGVFAWGQEAPSEPAPTPVATAPAAPAPRAPMPPRLDDVVHVDPITVKTKGKLPYDAFAMLAKATGTTIVGFNRNAVAGIGANVPVNMWGQHNAVP